MTVRGRWERQRTERRTNHARARLRARAVRQSRPAAPSDGRGRHRQQVKGRAASRRAQVLRRWLFPDQAAVAASPRRVPGAPSLCNWAEVALARCRGQYRRQTARPVPPCRPADARAEPLPASPPSVKQCPGRQWVRAPEPGLGPPPSVQTAAPPAAPASERVARKGWRTAHWLADECSGLGATSGATQGRAREADDDDRNRAGAASATERRTAAGTPGATLHAASWVFSGPSASRDKIPSATRPAATTGHPAGPTRLKEQSPTIGWAPPTDEPAQA